MIRTHHLTALALLSTSILIAGTSTLADEHDSRFDTVVVDRDEVDIPHGHLPEIRLVRAFPNLEFHRPIGFVHPPDGTDRVFIIEQRGQIKVFANDNDVEKADTFLDIREQVFMRHNEEGLLSLEFHPDYKDNGFFYIWYSKSDPRRTVLSRFNVSSDDPNRADHESEQVLLEVEQPWGNHNGGTIKFGPDGYLYLSIGDGGAANDPRNYAQNNQSLLGTVIRIDVNRESGGKPYAIPEDNPFVNDENARDEIWAYGLRNIWRMSFDRETGDLWAGDVGQNQWEFVYLIDVPGGNYGWNIREGSQPFRPREVDVPLIDPVIEYSQRARHGHSITGGYVYRGKEIEGLIGAYVYGDYVTGNIWALTLEKRKVTSYRKIYDPDGRPPYITSFGEDKHGELYICAFDRIDRAPGRIFRIAD